MQQKQIGNLIVIGGAEDKKGDSTVLKHVSEMLGVQSKMMVLTTASQNPAEVGHLYRTTFHNLGIPQVEVLNIDTREDANSKENAEKLRSSQGIFMTGGDQLRITSIIGGTSAYEALLDAYHQGALIAGTSAGASVMSATMIVEGIDNDAARKCTLKMAPGLGLLEGAIIDQYFGQRGRIGRLLCAVAENPSILGIGIDEDTAIKVYPDLRFEVIGNNAVTVIDGKSIGSTNVSELNQGEILAITNVTMHVLPHGYGMSLINREVFRMR